MLLSLITILAVIFQLKYQNNPTEFETVHSIMVLFIISIFTYAGFWAAEILTRTGHGNCHSFCGKMSILFGALSSFLMTLSIIRILGWCLLALWGIIFVWVLCHSTEELGTLFHRTWSYISGKLKQLGEWFDQVWQCMCQKPNQLLEWCCRAWRGDDLRRQQQQGRLPV